MDSYRVERRAAIRLQLPDKDAEIEPLPTDDGSQNETEVDRLSNILETFNDQFGNITWADSDRIHKLITEDIPQKWRLTLLTETRGRVRTNKMPALSMTKHYSEWCLVS